MVPLSGGILYIIAWVVTLAVAFTSLRELPPGAYENVYWTTFLPHVHIAYIYTSVVPTTNLISCIEQEI